MRYKKRFLNLSFRTKKKVWFIFLVSSIIIITISYVSMQSFSMLTHSIEQLSKPDHKIDLMNETIREIFEAENYIQTYISSGDASMEFKYMDYIAGARSKMEQMKISLHDDTIQKRRVDSLQILFDIKLQYLKAYLQLKNKTQSIAYSDDALKQISEQLPDSSVLSLLLLLQNMK